MAQIQINLTGIDGLANRFYGDKPYSSSKPHHRYYGFGDQFAEGIYNPISHLGYLSPANATTKAVSGTTNFLLTSAVISISRLRSTLTDSIYFADEAVDGTRGKIMNLDTEIDTSLDQAYELPIFGSPSQYAKVEDMILYQLDGIQKIFFASRNTTGPLNSGRVGYAGSDFSSPDDDWSSAVHDLLVIPNGNRMVFVPSDNGFLYLLESNTVHKIDGGATGGTTGIITPNVLVFLGTRGSVNNDVSQIVDGIDTRGRMWIGLHVAQNFGYSEGNLNNKVLTQECGVYVWDRRTTVAGIQDFIPIYGAREIKSMHKFQGQPACFTISSDGYTQFRMWNGSEFKVVKTLGKDAYPPYRRHSAHEDGEILYWLGNDGYIYAYGRIEPEQDNALYIVGDMTQHVSNGHTYSGSGVLVAVNGTESVTSGRNAEGLAFYISFKDTGGNHLKKWYVHGIDSIASNNQLAHQGNVYTLVRYLPTNSTVTYVDIACIPTQNSSSDAIATVKYYFNQSSTPSMTKTITKEQAAKGYIQHEINKPFVHAIQMEIEWNTSETNGQDFFRPAFALVGYQETLTRKQS